MISSHSKRGNACVVDMHRGFNNTLKCFLVKNISRFNTYYGFRGSERGEVQGLCFSLSVDTILEGQAENHRNCFCQKDE